MAATGEIQIGAVLGGTYQITGLLGRGGMGTVWAASHLRLPGKQVAVKLLIAAHQTDESYARFRREAEIASRIGHPNIVEVLDWNTLPDGTPYLVLELLQGESLSARMLRGPMSLAQTIDLVRQIGSALHAAHRAGVVHRDLKPDNIFVCPTDAGGHITDRVKILDFGISKIKNSTTLQTQEARILGTPQYMAPEQAQGKNQLVDQRTNLFALGVIVYELLAGKPPFGGDNIAEVVFKVVFGDPEPLGSLVPGLPPHVLAAVAKALSKEQDQRQPDILTFVAELTGRPLSTLDRARLSKVESAFAPPTGAPSRPPPGLGTGGTAAAAGTAGTGAGLGTDRTAAALGTAGTVARPGVSPTPTPPRGDGTALPPPPSRRSLYLGLAILVLLGGAGAAFALLGSRGAPAGPTAPGPLARATATPGPPRPGPPAAAPPADAAPRAAAAPASAPGGPDQATTAATPAADAGAVAAGALDAGAVAAQAVDAGAAAALRAEAAPVAAAHPDAAPVAAAHPDAAPVAAAHPDAAPVAAAHPDAAPRVVKASPRPPAPRPPAPPAAAPAESAPPESVRAELAEGELALSRGSYAEALRLGRHSLQTRVTPHAYSLMARAYCGMRDLGGARAMLENLRGVPRTLVYARCRRMGFPLD